MGLGHAHIYTSRFSSTLYGVQIKTGSDHALAILYMGSSYDPEIQNEEPSPAMFPIYLSFVSHKKILDTGQYEKLDVIKDLYIAIRRPVFKYFQILFMAFIWIDALERKFEIWVLYCRLVSKVTPNTLTLSEDGIVFLDRDRSRRPTKPVKRATLKFIRISIHIVIIKPWNCAMGVSLEWDF